MKIRYKILPTSQRCERMRHVIEQHVQGQLEFKFFVCHLKIRIGQTNEQNATLIPRE